mmetsp:Transcript_1059/g.1997  ORF Transcript_1059/g.1997 Transcript_1059/m.1997 type:complete len:95 (+) Transcript_1059:1510-1794(+)
MSLNFSSKIDHIDEFTICVYCTNNFCQKNGETQHIMYVYNSTVSADAFYAEPNVKVNDWKSWKFNPMRFDKFKSHFSRSGRWDTNNISNGLFRV